jgi:pimeloyl-ACP methyl ester carboxylesterase
VAAETWKEAAKPTPIKVRLPAAGVTVDGVIQVLARPDGGRRVVLVIAPNTVEVDIDKAGAVTHAQVPLQRLEVRPEGAPAPQAGAAQHGPPSGIAEEPLEVRSGGVTLRGVLWRPADVQGPLPTALVIVGSGPTDRDGNATLGLASDCYRLLAEGLARRGVATLRYDKRGIGASDPADEAKLTIDQYADDAVAWVARLRQEARVGKLTVIGHSEGGLVALLVAHKVALDGLALVATGGRPFAAILHEQLARQHHGAELEALDRILDDITHGRPFKLPPPALQVLFRPSVAGFLRSELVLDPVALTRRLPLSPTIIQGETDMQISVEDARRLAGARADARLVLLPRVNHLLKEETARVLLQASYSDPTRPLGPGVLDAVAGAIAR